MMPRFYAYLDKVFDFRAQAGTLRDSRPEPIIPTAAVFTLRIKRNKLLSTTTGWFFAAVDGHEFFRQPQTLLRPVPDAHLDSG